MIKILILLSIVTSSYLCIDAKASEFYDQLSFSPGMQNVTYAENQSSLQSTSSTTQTAAASGSISMIGLNAAYEFMAKDQRSFFVSTAFPLVSSGDTSFFTLGGGINFYINSLSSKFSSTTAGSKVTVTPKLRYYWGLDLGMGYLVYSTKTAKKSDILFNLGAHGGLKYGISDNYDLKSELFVSRGTGVATATFNIGLYFGINFFLGDN